VRRNARLILVTLALILSAAAFVLRLTGMDARAETWEIIVPGVVAATMIFLLIGELRSGPGGRR
jgi:hypothetical protein